MQRRKGTGVIIKIYHFASDFFFISSGDEICLSLSIKYLLNLYSYTVLSNLLDIGLIGEAECELNPVQEQNLKASQSAETLVSATVRKVDLKNLVLFLPRERKNRDLLV